MAFRGWVKKNATAIGVVSSISSIVIAAIGGIWTFVVYVSEPPSGVPGAKLKATGQDIIQVDSGGGDVTVIKGEKVDVVAIVDGLVADATRREAALREQHQQQLAETQQREQELREQLEKVVRALVDEGAKPNAPAGINSALALLAKGKTEAAETIFQDVLERREDEAGADPAQINAEAHVLEAELARVMKVNQKLSAEIDQSRANIAARRPRFAELIAEAQRELAGSG